MYFFDTYNRSHKKSFFNSFILSLFLLPLLYSALRDQFLYKFIFIYEFLFFCQYSSLIDNVRVWWRKGECLSVGGDTGSLRYRIYNKAHKSFDFYFSSTIDGNFQNVILFFFFRN